MAIYKNPTGKTLDTSKYTNLKEGKDLDNWVASQSLFEGYMPEATMQAPNTPVQPATPAPAPVDTSVIDAETLMKPVDNTRMNEAAKLGTFVSYNPETGQVDTKSRTPKAFSGENAYDPKTQLLETRIPNVEALQSGEWIVTNKVGQDYYGVKKPVTPTVTPPGGTPGAAGTTNAGTVAEPEKPKSYLDELEETANIDRGAIRDDLKEEAGIPTIQQNISTAQEKANKTLSTIEQKRTDLEATNILDEEAKIALKNKLEGQGRGIPMAIINRQLLSGLEDLDQAQRLERLYSTYELNSNINQYNAELRNVQLLQGQYAMAMDNVRESMGDWEETQRLKLMVLEEKGLIEKEARAKAEKEIEFERNLMLEGYTHVEDTATYDKIVKDLGVTASNFSQFFYKDPNGKIYLKPDNSKNVVSTITANGMLYGINEKGDIVKTYGKSGNFQYQDNDDGTYTVFDPSTGDVVVNASPTRASLSLGDGIVTAYGSPAWSHGLDFVLDGGKGASVASPVDGEVIFAGTSGGFGNQVKIRTTGGEELWLSHLDSFNVKVGDMIESGMVIGAQGNTGTVMGMNGQKYSPAEIAAGKGTHLDITIKDLEGNFYTPKQVAEVLGGGMTGNNDMVGLQALEMLADITPRLVNNEKAVKVAENAIKKYGIEGARDYIEDQLRYSGQSEQYQEFRNIAGAALTNTPPTQRKMIEDVLDDYIESNDLAGARDYILKVARESAPATEQKYANGREDALFALNEIDRLLTQFVQAGGNTGLIKGNIEKLQQRVLKETGNSTLAEIGNEISLVIQKYRQELTGAAFTESEAKEYAKLFPNIEKSPELNEALITSMRSAYERNLNMFYQRQLGGTGNWNKLQELTGQFNWGNPDFGGDDFWANLSDEEFLNSFK